MTLWCQRERCMETGEKKPIHENFIPAVDRFAIPSTAHVWEINHKSSSNLEQHLIKFTANSKSLINQTPSYYHKIITVAGPGRWERCVLSSNSHSKPEDAALKQENGSLITVWGRWWVFFALPLENRTLSDFALDCLVWSALDRRSTVAEWSRISGVISQVSHYRTIAIATEYICPWACTCGDWVFISAMGCSHDWAHIKLVS